jgi:hypothetical protein
MQDLTWKAQYDDQTIVRQDNLGYDDLDHSKLVAFALFNGDVKVIQINLRKEDRLIWRRRVAMKVGGVSEICHILGKQATIDGVNKQWVCGYFVSDGHIEFAPKFTKGDAWLYPPQFLEGEWC